MKPPTHEEVKRIVDKLCERAEYSPDVIERLTLAAYIAAAEQVERERVELRANQNRLLQVAVEAIRLVHGSELGDHYSHEPCGECGLGGHGALREALTKALGSGYTKLVWGKDMNADWDGLREAAAKAVEEAIPTAPSPRAEPALPNSSTGSHEPA